MSTITSASEVGGRSHQEDEFLIINTSDGGSLLVIADGHGGEEASKAVTDIIKEGWYQVSPGFEKQALEKIISRASAVVSRYSAGTTLSVVHIPPDQKEAFIAIVGDSPVVAPLPETDSYHVSPEHNVRTNLAEREAAEERGGRYGQGYMWEVGGGGYGSDYGQGLQMGRALGDANLTFLSHEPEIYSVPLGAWILVGSDGVFDPSHDGSQDEITAVVGLIEDGADAKAVVDRAVNLPTQDNATAILWRR